ncbi:MAG: cupin domain-containing protein [Eubacteriales bacterium]|nr:cupin domain-containing protein [Eubacteriales bacterium]
MVRRSKDKKVQVNEHKFGGTGSVTVRHLTDSPEELYQKGSVFAHSTLLPGCSIGYHVHQGEEEVYYIYSGEGEFNDNGELKTVAAGDVTITRSGEGHGLKNRGTDPLEFIALIVYEGGM